MHIPPYVIGGLLALLFTYAIAYEMRWVAQGLGAMTPPGGRHIHTQPVPRLGGLAIFGGALLALLATIPIDQSLALVRETRYVVLAVPYNPLPLPVVGILLGAAAITALGAIDDVRSLPGRVKFPLIYAAASIPVWFGMTTDFITHPVTGAVVPRGVTGKVFTVVWLGSMAIAMNSIDGVDGLAAGVSVITGMTLLSAAAYRHDVLTMTLAAAAAGSALGFLRHNFNPARSFMGDSGSMLLGFLLGAAAVRGLAKAATALSLAVLCSHSRCLFWTPATPSSGGTGTASLSSSRIGATCTIACWIAGCHSAKSSSCCGCCRPSSGSVGWPQLASAGRRP